MITSSYIFGGSLIVSTSFSGVELEGLVFATMLMKKNMLSTIYHDIVILYPSINNKYILHAVGQIDQ